MAGFDCAQAGACEEEFRLRNDPPPHRPQRFDAERQRQRPLFAGIHLLAGQGDLFAVDGEGPADG